MAKKINILEKIPYEKIWAIPPWQRWLAAGGVILLFFVIYFFASYKNTVEQIEKLVSKRETLKSDYQRYVKYTKKIPQLERDIATLNIKLKNARIQLPNEKEIPELLTLISDTGTETGLEFLLFKPSSEEKVDFYAKVPVEIVVLGNFHNVATFFDKVRKLSRIVDISEVKIKTKASKKGPVILETSCRATTYKYLEKEALETKPKKKKK